MPLVFPKKAPGGIVTIVTAFAVTLNDFEKLPSARSTLPVVDISEVIYNTMLLALFPVTPLIWSM
jgi:hypothetical protein